jgi:hypothetical protein
MSVMRLSQSGSEVTAASAVAANKDMSAAINATPWLSAPQRPGGPRGGAGSPHLAGCLSVRVLVGCRPGSSRPASKCAAKILAEEHEWGVIETPVEHREFSCHLPNERLRGVLGLVRSIRSGRFRHQLQNCACRIQRIPRSPLCAAIVAKWRLHAHFSPWFC